MTCLVRNGYTDEYKIQHIINLVKPLNFNSENALNVGKMVAITKHLGLSLGDRACLVAAKILDLPVYTADRKWAEVKDILKINVIQIRP
ncbi:MAG: hypothetical protein ACK5Z5_03365 [Neisseriaceae bacterium]